MPKFTVDKLIAKYGLQGGRNALTPYALENTDISGRQLRKLYTELRDIANNNFPPPMPHRGNVGGFHAFNI